MHEEEKKKSMPLWGIILICVLFAALAVTIVLLILEGSGTKDDTTATTIADVEDPEATNSGDTIDIGDAKVGYGENEVTDIASYSVNSITAEDMRTIVAVNADDEGCLTAGELQIYYWLEFYNFCNYYGYYLSYFGMDVQTPLDQQNSLAEGYTWEQYLLESAVLSFEQNYAFARIAEAEGMSLPEEVEEGIADLSDPDGDFATDAKEAGYDSAEAYLQANFGQGITIEDYQNYLRTYYLGNEYYHAQYEQAIAALTDDEITDYYNNNLESYEEEGVYQQDTIDVRHILIMPEKDEDGNVTDEALNAAQTQAQEILDLWLTDPTEDYFAELADAYSEDGGSNTEGGLYTYVYEGKMVQEFNDWCFDETRVEGDYAIVQTTYGFHIMYFVGHSCHWKDSVAEDLASKSMSAMVEEITPLYPVRFDYTKVRLFDLITANTSAE